jgi:D-alanyl-D-alanine-carboxypeptidase/D-alanyl-D-alanine-endopeptidase
MKTALAAIALLFVTSQNVMAQGWTPPSDDEIRKILAHRIDDEHQGIGMVVGIVSPAGRRIISYGVFDQKDPRPVNGDTIFEIGSTTKVFTGLLLADMAQRGEVGLDEPAQKYLPPGVTMPSRDGKQITLLQLATHMSGLPLVPTNMPTANPLNPYADYSPKRLYDFLSSYQLPRDPNAQWEYSNLGPGLLGDLLSRRASTDYETLVRQRITEPLAMKDTVISLSPAQKQRFAVGHNRQLQITSYWDLGALPGAGALRSTANDLLTFVSAAMGLTDTPLHAAMNSMLRVYGPIQPGAEQANIWAWNTSNGIRVVQKGGETGGFFSYIGFNPATRTGVVVLSNALTAEPPADIALHILTGSALSVSPTAPQAVSVDPKILATYTGIYQFMGQNAVVSLNGGKLFVKGAGPGSELVPLGTDEFYMVLNGAHLTFDVGADGHVTGFVVHIGANSVPAKRME